MITRMEALDILHEFTESESLRRHALAVETAMRAYALRFGGDVEEWGITGLLHDFDYERHPCMDEHPMVGSGILEQRGVDEHILRAILSHAEHTGVPRVSMMEHALFAVDELCGRGLRASGSLHSQRSGLVGEEEDEGQSLRARGEPR